SSGIVMARTDDDDEKDVAAMVLRLKSPDSHQRWKAVIDLYDYGPRAKSAAPALADALRDEDGNVGYDAARALGKLGMAAVPHLVTATRDKSAEVRENAAMGLRDIGPEAKDAVPALVPLLRDPVQDVRGMACGALGAIGPAARPAVPALVA